MHTILLTTVLALAPAEPADTQLIEPEVVEAHAPEVETEATEPESETAPGSEPQVDVTEAEPTAEAESEAEPEPEPQVDDTEAGPAEAERATEAQPAAAERRTVVVLDARVADGDPGTAAVVTQALAEALGKRPELDVITHSDLDQMLAHAEDREKLGCDDDLSCLAEVSRVAKSELVVNTWVGAVGRNIVVSLTLFDARRAQSLSHVTDTIDGIDQLPTALPVLTAELFGIDSATPQMVFHLPAGKTTSFAVFDLKPAGVEEELTQNLTQILSAAIKQIRGTTVISSEDVDAMLQLEEEKERLGCAEDYSCLAEIAGALGVDNLVVGNIGTVAARYVVSLRLIDTRNAQVTSRVTEMFHGAEEQLIGAVRYGAYLLLGVDPQASGRLVVTSTEQEAEVFMDGVSLGELPLPPVGELVPGRHALRISKDGFEEWQSEIYVDPEGITAVWADLIERPEPWYTRWWIWAGAAAVVAGGFTLYYFQATKVPGTDLGTHPMP